MKEEETEGEPGADCVLGSVQKRNNREGRREVGAKWAEGASNLEDAGPVRCFGSSCRGT